MSASAHASHRTPRLFGIPCWIIPVIAGCLWFATLLSMLITWIVQGSPTYPDLSKGQTLAYISDIASTNWGQPLFITSSTITVIIFGVAYAVERWLRHRALLLHVSSRRATVLSWCATVSSVIGAFGLIMLTTFDKKDHEMVHLCMVGVFIAGYVFAAIFMALEKHRLSKKYPCNVWISRSWKTKAFFAVLESILTLFFVVLAWCGYPNESVITEWIIAPLFCLYMCSFAMDFLPTPEMEFMDVSWLILGAADMARNDSASTSRNESVFTSGTNEKEWEIEMAMRSDSVASMDDDAMGEREKEIEMIHRETERVRGPSNAAIKNWSLRDPGNVVVKESKLSPVTTSQSRFEHTDGGEYSVSPRDTRGVPRVG